MTDGEPTLGEAIRRLDAVALQLTALAAQMAQDRRDTAATFVPREVYNASHATHDRRITNLEDENEERDKTAAEVRRQLLFIVLGAFVTALCALIVAIYLGSGGSPP